MTDANITIYYSGFEDRGTGTGVELKTRKVPAKSVTVAGSRSVDAKPNANIDGPVQGATLSYENLKLTVQGVYLRPNTESTHTYLDMADILLLYTMAYNGTNAPIINAKYGGIDLVGLEGDTDIKVLLNSFDTSLDPSDSRDAYLPRVSLNFTETK